MRLENREIIFGQSKQTHRRPQALRMFRVRRMFKIFLEMNKRAGRLDQTLEKNRVAGLHFQPELLEHVVGFVVKLLVPTAEVSAIERVFIDRNAGEIDIFSSEFAHEL